MQNTQELVTQCALSILLTANSDAVSQVEKSKERSIFKKILLKQNYMDQGPCQQQNFKLKNRFLFTPQIKERNKHLFTDHSN